MTEAAQLRQAIRAALARLIAGGTANVAEARCLLAEAERTPADVPHREPTGIEYRGG